MQRLPNALYTADQVRELDRRLIEDHGVDGFALMQRAGEAAFAVLCRRWPEAKRLAILVGKGNNGGDGYVIASLAARAGLDVTLCTVGDHQQLRGAAKQAARGCRQSGAALCTFENNGLPPADVYVDALLGTGLDRPLAGAYRDAAEALNRAARPVLAIDVPTGANPDSGAVGESCVNAEATISFIGLKLGLLTGPALDVAGALIFDSLAAPDSVYQNMTPAARRIVSGDLKRWLLPRKSNAHKGNFGHVLVIGGGRGMAGAALLAGEAALRTGAGLVSLAVHPANANAARRPELMVHGIEHADEVDSLLAGATVLALGPGLGTGAWSLALWKKAVTSVTPLVVDADGLNLLADNSSAMESGSERAVLTPHPGEAARLLNCDTKAVQADRPAAARELARRFGAVAVLKGAGTLVSEPAGGLWLCDKGNPGMASGGMGDVLTGIIAGLLAQGLDARRAACAGVLAHALAGDRAAQRGERGLLASDLVQSLRGVINW